MEINKIQLEEGEQILWSRTNSENLLWKKLCDLPVIQLVITGIVVFIVPIIFMLQEGSITLQTYLLMIQGFAIGISPLLIVFLIIDMFILFNFKKTQKKTFSKAKELKNYEYWDILTNKRLIVKDYEINFNYGFFKHNQDFVKRENDLFYIYLKDLSTIKMCKQYSEDFINLNLDFYFDSVWPYDISIEWSKEDDCEKFIENFLKIVPNSVFYS